MNKTVCDACYQECGHDSVVLDMKLRFDTIRDVDYDVIKLNKDLCHSCASAIHRLMVDLGRNQ